MQKGTKSVRLPDDEADSALDRDRKMTRRAAIPSRSKVALVDELRIARGRRDMLRVTFDFKGPIFHRMAITAIRPP